jgi:hypothetical protein
MGTQHAPVDPVERDLAAAQLDDIALANQGRPWEVWKDFVLRWYLDAIARARAEAWVPGMAGSQDPVVEEALNRFYRHHMRLAIGHLRAENLELRRKVVDAAACARFYASGANDAGERAHVMLAALEPRVNGAPATAGQSH